jgi:hypothetical protein
LLVGASLVLFVLSQREHVVHDWRLQEEPEHHIAYKWILPLVQWDRLFLPNQVVLGVAHVANDEVESQPVNAWKLMMLALKWLRLRLRNQMDRITLLLPSCSTDHPNLYVLVAADKVK